MPAAEVLAALRAGRLDAVLAEREPQAAGEDEDDDAPPITRADLAGMAPEEVAAALRAGRLNHLLKKGA